MLALSAIRLYYVYSVLFLTVFFSFIFILDLENVSVRYFENRQNDQRVSENELRYTHMLTHVRRAYQLYCRLPSELASWLIDPERCKVPVWLYAVPVASQKNDSLYLILSSYTNWLQREGTSLWSPCVIGQTIILSSRFFFFMVALCNRADHYIFAL